MKKLISLVMVLALLITTATFGTAFAAQVPSVKSDTPASITLVQGKTYTFKLTKSGTSAALASTVGNKSILKILSQKKVGNSYYLKVNAIGKPGTATAIYTTLSGKKAQRQCVITVGKPTSPPSSALSMTLDCASTINATAGSSFVVTAATNVSDVSYRISTSSGDFAVDPIDTGKFSIKVLNAGKGTVTIIAIKSGYTNASKTFTINATGSAEEPAASVSTSSLIAEINKHRKSVGVSALVQDSTLMTVAGIRAKEITTHFGHKNYTEYCHDKGIDSNIFIYENITGCLKTDNAAEVIQYFIDSPAHETAQTQNQITHIGVGYANGSDMNYVCVLFY